ncbi:MAG: hypothetical protein ACI837_002041 [Crocinitomicaceae bacterium]|jgi:hypothetical protein
MKKYQRRSLTIFFGASFGLALLFFLFPINLFDGVIEYKNGIQEIKESTNLSLSYFIGIGYDEADMATIKDFYLTTKGIIIAIIFIFGFPGVLAYRSYLKRANAESN